MVFNNDEESQALVSDPSGEDRIRPSLTEKAKRRYLSQQKYTNRALHVPPSKIADLREETKIKVDLQNRMLNATFELAKRSFERAHMNQSLWFPRLQQGMNYITDCVQGGEPTLIDFMRTYNLFKGWYPKLVEEVRINKETWDASAAATLQSMKQLVEKKIVADARPGVTETFNEWVEKELKQMQDDGKTLTHAHTDLAPDTFNCLLGEGGAEIDRVRQNLQTMHAIASESDATTNNNAILESFAPLLRIVWIVMILDFLVIYESVILGVLTQINMEFYVFMIGSEEDPAFSLGKNRFFWKLWRYARNLFFPILVLLYAVVGAELADLANSALQYPPFKTARASFMISLMSRTGILGGRLDRKRLRVIDVFFTWTLLLFICIFGMLWACYTSEDESLLDRVLNGMSCGSIFWTLLFLFLYGASRFYNNVILVKLIDSEMTESEVTPGETLEDGADSDQRCRTPADIVLFGKAQKISFSPQRCNKVLCQAIATYAIVPGDMHKNYLPLQNVLDMHRADDYAWNFDHIPDWFGKDEFKDSESWDQFSAKLTSNDKTLAVDNVGLWVWYFLGSLAVWIITLISGYCMEHGHKLAAVLINNNVGSAVSLFLLSQGARLYFPTFADNRLFRVHILCHVIFTLLFSVASIDLFEQVPTNLKPLMTWDNTSTDSAGVWHNDGNVSNITVPPYPACNMWWGSMQAKVHLLDLAAMAKYAYDEWETDEHYTRLLKESFGEQNVENVYYDPAKRFPRVVAARLCRNGEAGPCTIIMAVRGTSNKIEILTDISLFSTVVVMQMLDKMVPLLGTLPVAVLSTIIGDLRHPFMKTTQHKIVSDLTNIANQLRQNYSSDNLVISGHSLGGSFAELIGAKLRIPAVGFSAPGQFYLLKTFNLHREQIEQTLLTIMPSLDPVPHVASHIDMVQRIQCRMPTGVHRKPWECHSLDGTICELWRVCGDPLRRDFSKLCLSTPNPLVNGKCRGRPFGGKSADCISE